MYKDILHLGLKSEKAKQILEEIGTNEIIEVKDFTLLKAFLSQFDNYLIFLLIAAGLVSFLVGERIDSLFIFLIVLLNAAFGVFQEYKAEKALTSLKQMTITKVRVIRDSKETEIDSRFLVPGDLAYLEEGNKIPADGKIIKSWHLEINEASLTGESLPVVKNELDPQNNRIFMGTVVARGRTFCQITATGMQTQFGQITKTLSGIKIGKTPLHKKLDTFSKQIGIIGFAAAAIVFILSFIGDKNLVESFIFAVSLAIAVVPEGLPAVLTITLSIGVERMAKKKAIVRKLNSIETLGTVTLVATDKTGTLTTNKMRVKKIWVDNKEYSFDNHPYLSNQPFSKMILNSILCSTASLVRKMDGYDVIGDATEGALLLFSQDVGLIPDEAKKDWQIVDELAFNAVTKRMSVVVRKDQQSLVLTKGAPESVLPICTHIQIGSRVMPLEPKQAHIIETEFKKFADRGLRTIAFSYRNDHVKEIERNQIFLGFIGIADPIRIEIKAAVVKAQSAGIKVVMITGDNELTAGTIGKEAGIFQDNELIITGKQLDDYSDEELMPLLAQAKIFARIAPHHKHRLVHLYQKMGEIVAVTGDGVNDVLALKQADVGVTMGITGTDVAKDTAHIILTDDNFATLIDAIEQGRNIYYHIKNAIKYLLTCNIGEVVYILSAVIFNLPILTPLQILYINLVTDGLPAISLAFSPDHKEVMREKPRQDSSLFNQKDYRLIGSMGVLTAVVAFVSILPFISSRPNVVITVLFSVIIFVQPFILMSLWLSHKLLITNLKMLNKPMFIAAFLFPFVLQPIMMNSKILQGVFSVVPVDLPLFAYTILVSSFILIPLEVFKKKLT